MIKLTIQKLSNGGFIVMVKPVNSGIEDHPVFASSSIDEALAFIRKTLQPVQPTTGISGPVGFAGLDPKHYAFNGFGPNGS